MDYNLESCKAAQIAKPYPSKIAPGLFFQCYCEECPKNVGCHCDESPFFQFIAAIAKTEKEPQYATVDA